MTAAASYPPIIEGDAFVNLLYGAQVGLYAIGHPGGFIIDADGMGAAVMVEQAVAMLPYSGVDGH